MRPTGHRPARRRHMQSDTMRDAKAAALADFRGAGRSAQELRPGGDAVRAPLLSARTRRRRSTPATSAAASAGSGATCGTITGAALALGVRDLHDPDTWAGRAPEGVEQLQAIVADFTARFAHTTCRELTGCDIDHARGVRRLQGPGHGRATLRRVRRLDVRARGRRPLTSRHGDVWENARRTSPPRTSKAGPRGSDRPYFGETAELSAGGKGGPGTRVP